MAKIDNEKMWASILNYQPTMEEKENLRDVMRKVRSIGDFSFHRILNTIIRGALREQELMEKDGEIVDYMPEYKVGDWLVHKDGYYNSRPFMVVDVPENDAAFVKVQFQDGCEFTPNVLLIRKWEITDAVAGDILVAKHPKGCELEQTIFMFKEIRDRDYVTKAVEYYASVNGLDFNLNDQGNGYMGSLDEPKNTISNYRPATNEECNAFHVLMDQNGYEFDFGKKELRKKSFHVNYPETDYLQLRQEVDALRGMVDALKAHVGFIDIKDRTPDFDNDINN